MGHILLRRKAYSQLEVEIISQIIINSINMKLHPIQTAILQQKYVVLLNSLNAKLWYTYFVFNFYEMANSINIIFYIFLNDF